MAKFIVPLHELPYPMSDGTQKFRFRIITEDRNVVSYWSPIFKIVNTNQLEPLIPSFAASAIYDSRTDSVSISLATNQVTDDYTEYLDNYDIFVNWDSAGYEFYNRMNANGINIPSSGSATVIVKGQYPSQYVDNSPVENLKLEVFKTSTLSLIDLRDTAAISASVTNISASVTQINQNVANVEGLIYALS
jgi:hypothetical protein